MSTTENLLFIDANKYLDLYRTNTGKALLGPLSDLAGHIFVTQQVVNEVQRNKVRVAIEFINSKFKDLQLQMFNVPDHLTGVNPDEGKALRKQMIDIAKQIKELNKSLESFANGIVDQIVNEKDEVFQALVPIFATATLYSSEELQRARSRRELGNPPGKKTDTLGDQLSWEPVLTCMKGKKRLWIISRDEDYGSFYGDKGFLNRFLYNEVRQLDSDAEVFFFNETSKGIEHFIHVTGLKAKHRLTPEKMKEIEDEEKSLPILRSLGREEGAVAASGLFSFLTPQERLQLASDFSKKHQSEIWWKSVWPNNSTEGAVKALNDALEPSFIEKAEIALNKALKKKPTR